MIPNSVLLEAPTTPAVEVADLMVHLRIDNEAENGLLETIIGAATERVEEYIDLKIMKQKWAIYWDDLTIRRKDEPWWDGTREMAVSALYGCNEKITLPFGKVMGNDYAFSYVDEDGNDVVYDNTLYKVDSISKQSRLALKSGSTWPSSASNMNAYNFTAFFGLAEDNKRIPNAIKQAILVMCASMYENKGDEIMNTPMPAATQMLLAPWRSIKV